MTKIFMTAFQKVKLNPVLNLVPWLSVVIFNHWTGFITEFIKNFMMEIYWMGIFHSFHSHLRKPQAIKWDVWAVAVYKNFNQLKQNTEYETHHKKILFLLFAQPIFNQKLKNSVLRFFFLNFEIAAKKLLMSLLFCQMKVLCLFHK